MIGHSGGAALCIPVAARVLALDPGFAARARTCVLALGTLIPLVQFYRGTDHVDAMIRTLATGLDLTYVDCQARKDIMNVCGADSMTLAGMAQAARRTGLVWTLRFRDMISPALYARMRWNFFRMHFQFIMASDQRGPYDYFMMVCGPVPLTEWVRNGAQAAAAFAPDGAYASARPDATGAHLPQAVLR